VLNALKQWKLACPKGELGLVFPNGSGNLEAHVNIIRHLLWPVQIAAAQKWRSQISGNALFPALFRVVVH